MAFNENINFWNNQTVASGESMSAPLEKLLENDNYLKNKSDENEPKVFFAEYEITTFEEVTNALAANKMVFLRKTITVSEENHVIYLPLSNKKTSEPNVYTFSGISGHRGDLVISFTLSENDIWSLGNDSFPSKQIQVVAYGSTSLTDLNSYFNEGLYLICHRGNEYLPLIRRSLVNDSYEYIFSGSYEDKVVKLKCEVSGWTEEVIGLKIIKDNAYDSETDPSQPDNITDIEQLIFFRDVGRDSKQTVVMSEERTYGVLIPSPSSEADIGKVPMLNNLGQIVWETVPTQDSVTAIQAVIPATASSTNQLADKAYVDFGMEQNTAKYLSADALGNPFTGSVPDADDTYFYAGATTLPTKNDYLIVNGDTAHDGAVTRYYFAQDGEVGQWQFQYVVNNSPLNASQLDAINSGWTATKTSEHDSDHTTLSAHVGDTTGNPHGVTKAQVGLGNVENYKAVSVVASQGLTDAEKVAARGNIDAAKDLVSLTITPVIVGTTATLTIEQGSFASIDLTSETALTAVAVVLTNASGVAFPVWWFKIKAGSDITLSVEIGAVAVGWLGATITSITSGKTVEINVVDNVACGGELV